MSPAPWQLIAMEATIIGASGEPSTEETSQVSAHEPEINPVTSRRTLVVCDPAHHGGRPMLADGHAPVEVLMVELNAGRSPEELAEEFDACLEDIYLLMEAAALPMSERTLDALHPDDAGHLELPPQTEAFLDELEHVSVERATNIATIARRQQKLSGEAMVRLSQAASAQGMVELCADVHDIAWETARPVHYDWMWLVACAQAAEATLMQPFISDRDYEALMRPYRDAKPTA